jgi:hypothetical protein
MAWFNIVVSNHGGAVGVFNLTNLISYFRNSLSLCGHETTVGYTALPKAINLYFEHFIGPSWAVEFREMRKSHNLKIGVVATELMLTVNGKLEIPYAKNGIAYNGGQNQERGELRLRGFEAVLSEVDFLWTLLGRTAAEFKPRTRVCEFFPLGSVGPMRQEVWKSPKEIGVFFFGKNTPHRSNAFAAFAKQGINPVTVGQGFRHEWQPQVVVDSMTDRSKIGLNLTLHGLEEAENGVDPRFASCQRIVDMLNRNTCVVSEEIPLDNPYRDFIVSAPVDKLAERCRKILDGDSWHEIGATCAANFHDVMDVRKICQPAIERTLAALIF